MERERSYQIPRDKPADLLEGNSSQLLIPELCVLLKRKKAKSEAQRGKPKGTLESEIRTARLY